MENQPTIADHNFTEAATGQYIVAIGASAGGLEAIHEFFDNMSSTEDLSFIIIQHLSSDYKSLLVELVSKHTQMKVLEAGQDMSVEKNCIYVIPSKNLMTMQDGKLRLHEKGVSNIPNTAIDMFLHSLAADNGNKSIAVILSGTGTDGSRGIESIKDAGGMVIVQEPSTAKFNGMPNSAIASGNADYVLAPSEMPGEIYRYVEVNNKEDIDPAVFSTKKLDEVLKQVKKTTGFDFHYYKTPTILRRLSKRMLQLGLSGADDYIEYLASHPDECKRLSKEFLIGVTKFFRDKEAFEFIETDILPSITASKEEGGIVKLWVTACSTGEEAYSLAILVDRHLQHIGKNLSVKIFATDIDPLAISFAARGAYPSTISQDVPPDILEKYFEKQGNKYVIISRIRKYVVFAGHNIFKDPPFIKNDLVTCRNMLIYMSSALQKKVLNTLHFSLNDSGFLFLGSSENISIFKPFLDEVNSKWKMYRKSMNAKPLTGAELIQHPQYDKQITPTVNSKSGNSKGSSILVDGLKDVLAEEFNCAAILLDHNNELKEATGDFRRYLSLPEKKLNLNILKMVSQDLAHVLQSALRKLERDEAKVVMRNVRMIRNSEPTLLDIVVKKLLLPYDKPNILIVIKDQKQLISFEPGVPSKFSDDPEVNAEYVQELESDLRETRLNLNNAIESLESANEELQLNNEELLSANEELQSSNEELQSLNEELHTLNSEHQLKIKELVELNDDLNNYFRTTDIGQIFLDKNLRIRKFNPAAVKLVNLIENDINRPISNISTNIRYEGLMKDVESVLRTTQPVEKEVELSNTKIVLMRIVPYVRQDQEADGVVISFIDVTSMKDLDKIINSVFNMSQSAIMVFKSVRNFHNRLIDLEWVTANNSSGELLNSTAINSISGKLVSKESPVLLSDDLFEHYERVVESGVPAKLQKKLNIGGKDTWYDINTAKLNDGIIVTYTNITDQKDADERLRKNYNELIDVKEHLKNLNAVLEDRVRERTQALAESDGRFRLVSKATNDAIWDWNLVENKIWWNENFYQITGYAMDRDFSRADWLNSIHAADRARVQESITSTINKGLSQWSFEYRFLKADGTYARFLDRAYVLVDDHGTPYRMLGSMLDVTDLRKAEEAIVQNIEQTKFLAESMPLIVWTANIKGEVDFLNQQFMLYTGVPIERGLSRGWEQVVHPEDLEKLRTLWKNSIFAKRDFAIELRLRRFDNSYRWYLLRAKARKNASEKVVLWVGSNTDIHEQKLANEILEQRVFERTQELNHINQELESSNIELQQFAFVASHDLKEPLRKINMFSLIVKDKYLHSADDQARYLLDRVISSCTRMTRLVNDLLDFSRISITHLYEDTDLNHVISEILSDLELVINEKKAVIDIDPLPVIQAVPAQMRQVFQNIISNAIKFSQKDIAPLIKVTSQLIASKDFEAQPDDNGNFCRISIRDNGIGFDEQYASKIFTIFQRLHTKETYEGTGIGLAITKKIIEKHNGLITAHSATNEGSTFILVLPIQQAKEPLV